MSHRKPSLAHPIDETDHALGSPDAPVTVVEYADFECPYCAEAAPGIRLMLARYGSQVRYAFRHFPLEEVHPHALAAAEASECAAAQGQFWPMHDLLYRRQGKFTRTDLNGYAREVGLAAKRFDREMDGHVHVEKIHEHYRGGRQGRVRSTPGLFVNGHLLDVAFDLQVLYDAIDAELASS
jgi:protein-disulfide isomerase